ncbi:MAG: carboxypeptidase-like regulatory domain-containing protein [Nanoarchaeota archaeon]
MKKGVIITLLILIFVSYVNATTISGNIYDDLNGDSSIENENLTNANIILFDINNFNELNFEANGHYEFNVNPGSYIVSVKLNNSIVTYPEFGFYHVIINDNEIIDNKNFGNFKLGKISGYVYYNSNPISGVRVKLSNNFTYLTNNQGYYEFNSLNPGDYNITLFNKNIKNVIVNSASSSENNNFNIDYIPNNDVNEVEENVSWLNRIYQNLFE